MSDVAWNGILELKNRSKKHRISLDENIFLAKMTYSVGINVEEVRQVERRS